MLVMGSRGLVIVWDICVVRGGFWVFFQRFLVIVVIGSLRMIYIQVKLLFRVVFFRVSFLSWEVLEIFKFYRLLLRFFEGFFQYLFFQKGSIGIFVVIYEIVLVIVKNQVGIIYLGSLLKFLKLFMRQKEIEKRIFFVLLGEGSQFYFEKVLG